MKSMPSLVSLSSSPTEWVRTGPHVEPHPPAADMCRRCGESKSYARAYGCPVADPRCPHDRALRKKMAADLRRFDRRKRAAPGIARLLRRKRLPLVFQALCLDLHKLPRRLLRELLDAWVTTPGAPPHRVLARACFQWLANDLQGAGK